MKIDPQPEGHPCTWERRELMRLGAVSALPRPDEDQVAYRRPNGDVYVVYRSAGTGAWVQAWVPPGHPLREP